MALLWIASTLNKTTSQVKSQTPPPPPPGEEIVCPSRFKCLNVYEVSLLWAETYGCDGITGTSFAAMFCITGGTFFQTCVLKLVILI